MAGWYRFGALRDGGPMGPAYVVRVCVAPQRAAGRDVQVDRGSASADVWRKSGSPEFVSRSASAEPRSACGRLG